MQDTWRAGTAASSGPSRAMNVDIEQPAVIALCRKHKVSVSAIETLHSGGTRVVFTNGDGAATMRAAFGKRLIAGEVIRSSSLRNR